MAYTLQAIVASNGLIQASYVCVQLYQGFEMLPFNSNFLQQNNFQEAPILSNGSSLLPQNIDTFCVALSKVGNLAYLEAEYFGGAGEQAAILYSNGRTEEQYFGTNAISDALRKLGVERTYDSDEFEVLGLQQFRHSDDWV